MEMIMEWILLAVKVIITLIFLYAVYRLAKVKKVVLNLLGVAMGWSVILMVIPYMFIDSFIGTATWFALGIVLLLIDGFLACYFILAPNNYFFTFVHEGTAKFVVRGDKFQKCLIQWRGYTFDDEWNVVTEKTVKNGKIYKEPRHPLGGFRFYGIWPINDIHIYEFRWVGVTEEGKENPKREWLDSMILKDDVYLCKIPAAEDKDKLPLDFQVFLTIRIVNPYKAKFAVQRWLETVLNRIQPLMRQYISRYTYAELLPMRQEVGGKMWQELKEAKLVGRMEDPEPERGEFINRYGVEVRAIEVRQIEPPETWRAATLKKFEAERKAEAVVAEAKGDKKATITRAEGEVKRLEKVYSGIKKFGDLGKLVRTLEAAEKSPLAASLTIQAIPGLPEILRGVFAKPPEEITVKELRELKELVQKLLEKEKPEK